MKTFRYMLPGEVEEIEMTHNMEKRTLKCVIGVLVFLILLASIQIHHQQAEIRDLTHQYEMLLLQVTTRP